MDQLLRDLKQPGDATVVKDRPEKHYYVSVLVSREEPTPEKFYTIYERTPRGTFLRDLLWSRFERERQEQFTRELLKQLRAEAGPVDANGNFRIDSAVREKIERRGGDEGEV